jgi:hypothetical protein
VCGAECGIVTQGLAATANRHWLMYNAGANVAIDTATVRSGARSWKMTATAATNTGLGTIAPASQTFAYFRGYFRFPDATPTTRASIYRPLGTAGVDVNLKLLPSGVLVLGDGGADTGTSGPTLADNTWYGVEVETNVSANPNVSKWRTWSAGGGWVAQSNFSKAQAATTFQTSGSLFGSINDVQTVGHVVYFDDVMVGFGTTSEHYSDTVPNGGVVLRYRPTADMTHAFTTNDFEYNDTTGINSAATDIYTYLDDDDQTSIADFISQNVAWAAGTKAFGVTFADEAAESSPLAVGVTTTTHAAGTGANEINVRVSDDDATYTNVWGNWAGVGIDSSDTTAHFQHKVLATKPSGGAWTLAAVNGMRAQMGQSNDIVAIPYYDSISLEVAWSEYPLPGGMVRPYYANQAPARAASW